MLWLSTKTWACNCYFFVFKCKSFSFKGQGAGLIWISGYSRWHGIESLLNLYDFFFQNKNLSSAYEDDFVFLYLVVLWMKPLLVLLYSVFGKKNMQVGFGDVRNRYQSTGLREVNIVPSVFKLKTTTCF